MVATRIRIIPADEDPRLLWPNTSSLAQQLSLKRDNEDFPPLVSDPSTSHRAKLTPTPLAHAYSDVLVYGINRPCILKKLPVELREMIWEARMRADGNFDPLYGRIDIRDSLYNGRDPKRPHFLPRLCFVSKSTQDEIIGVFMRNSKFVIASVRGNTFFRKFIASVAKGLDHVRELHFDNFDFFPDYDRVTKELIPTNSDLELAVHYRGLHTLRLSFGIQWLRPLKFDENTPEYVCRLKTVEELVKKYRLHKLLDCDKLRKIHWDGRHQYGSPELGLADLANWAKNEFAKKNRQLETIVTWLH